MNSVPESLWKEFSTLPHTTVQLYISTQIRIWTFVPYKEEKPVAESDFTLHFSWIFLAWQYELLERWAGGSAGRGTGGGSVYWCLETKLSTRRCLVAATSSSKEFIMLLPVLHLKQSKRLRLSIEQFNCLVQLHSKLRASKAYCSVTSLSLEAYPGCMVQSSWVGVPDAYPPSVQTPPPAVPAGLASVTASGYVWCTFSSNVNCEPTI